MGAGPESLLLASSTPDCALTPRRPHRPSPMHCVVETTVVGSLRGGKIMRGEYKTGENILFKLIFKVFS